MSVSYRDLVRFTRNNSLTKEQQLANGIIGLSGEAGEVADIIKKHLFQGHPLDRDKLIKELGDVCWYFELLCDMLDVTRSEVEQLNQQKLLQRYPNGFSAQHSISRKPE